MNKEQAEPWPLRDEGREEKLTQTPHGWVSVTTLRPDATATLITCRFELVFAGPTCFWSERDARSG